MRRKDTRNRRGFTLVELILYVSVSALVALAAAGLIVIIIQARVKSQTVAEVEQVGSHVLNLITQTARNSLRINSPLPGGSSSVLSLANQSSTKNPTIFDVQSSTIRITEGAYQPVPLTSSRLLASSLLFQNLSRTNTSGTIRIQFTLTHQNPGSRNEYDYVKNFYGSATVR
ncbi:MAG: prepilin-type N-terminal cleavage/methylation domain-containing protein [Candidatus Liptonbacteria bacterium]|nr:prepilin-type N-terminal cleavage/methylation domain-containing protein [Candidatus Liptonbacteria bacterium]